MVDIWGRASTPASFTPLSHGQSLAIRKDWSDALRAVESKFHISSQDCNKLYKGVNDVYKNLDDINAAVRNFQKGTTSTNSSRNSVSGSLVNIVHTDIGHNITDIQKLNTGQEQMKESLKAMHEAQKMNTTKLRKLESELQQVANHAQNLQETIEKKIFVDICNVKEELGETTHGFEKLRRDGEQTKEALQEEKKSISSTNKDLQALHDEFTKTNTAMLELETRLLDSNNSLKSTRATLEELDNYVAKVHGDLERTKGDIVDMRGDASKAHDRVKKIHEGIDKTVASLQRMEAASQSLIHMKGKVQNAREDKGIENKTMVDLRSDVEVVGAAANAVRSCLKDINSVVLPSLYMGLGAAVMPPTPLRSMPQTPSWIMDRHPEKVSKGNHMAQNVFTWN